MKKLLVLAGLALFLFSCDLGEPDGIEGLGDNQKYLDYDRRVQIYHNMQSDIDSVDYQNVADFINSHVIDVLDNNEKPLFHDNVTIENIFSKTAMSYSARPIKPNQTEPGDLIFIFNYGYIYQAGFFLRAENDYMFFVTVSNGKVTTRSTLLSNKSIYIKRILIE